MRRSRGTATRCWTPVACACAAILLSAQSVQAQTARTASAAQTFDIEAYDVDGVTLLKQGDVEAAVYPFEGPGRTRGDIDHAREALEKAYHDRGLQTVVVELPPQSVSDNIVRLHVIEAPVGRLRVTGSRYFSPNAIRNEAPAFREGQVPDLNAAQAELADLNRLPDRRITPLLRAGAIPGTVDVELKVSDTLPLHGSVQVTNDHNADTPPLRVLSTLHYDNLWQLGHSLSFTYAVAPQDRAASEIFAGSYLAPLWGTRWNLMLYGYDSNSNVATLGGTNVLGKGYAFGLRAILQLPRKGDVAQSVSFGIDLKNFDENITFGSTSTADTIRYLPVNFVYTLQGDGPRVSGKATLGVTAGLRGLGGDTAIFQNKRANANPNFVHLNLDISDTVALGGGFEMNNRLSGQIADQPLVSSEEFAAGGLSSVRGYLQSEVVGDDGLTGSFEFRSPSLAPRLGAFVDDFRFFGFADGGVVRVLHPLAGQTDFFSLASAGLGLHAQLLKHLDGYVLGAVPLIEGPNTRRYRPEIFFTVNADF